MVTSGVGTMEKDIQKKDYIVEQHTQENDQIVHRAMQYTKSHFSYYIINFN